MAEMEKHMLSMPIIPCMWTARCPVAPWTVLRGGVKGEATCLPEDGCMAVTQRSQDLNL